MTVEEENLLVVTFYCRLWKKLPQHTVCFINLSYAQILFAFSLFDCIFLFIYSFILLKQQAARVELFPFAL